MNRPDIEGIAERWSKATEGSWEADLPACVCPGGDVYGFSLGGIIEGGCSFCTDGPYASWNDAQAIAHSWSDVNALLEWVRELEGREKRTFEAGFRWCLSEVDYDWDEGWEAECRVSWKAHQHQPKLIFRDESESQ